MQRRCPQVAQRSLVRAVFVRLCDASEDALAAIRLILFECDCSALLLATQPAPEADVNGSTSLS